MAINSVKVTMKIRNDTANNWLTANPILGMGEYGLETDTHLLKIGDGTTAWANLPYLNKIDSIYFSTNSDGTISFSQSFINLINALTSMRDSGAGLTITNAPINATDPVNKRYVDEAIAAAGHLTRQIAAALPSTSEGNENTIYMVQQNDGTYDEYMFINGAYDLIGNTATTYELPVATESDLGGVRSSQSANEIRVTQTGFMTLNRVSTSLLYVPVGDELVINGGTA